MPDIWVIANLVWKHTLYSQKMHTTPDQCFINIIHT